MIPIDTELIIGIVQSLLSRTKSRISLIVFSTCPIAMNIIIVDIHCSISLTLSFPVSQDVTVAFIYITDDCKFLTL